MRAANIITTVFAAISDAIIGTDPSTLAHSRRALRGHTRKMGFHSFTLKRKGYGVDCANVDKNIGGTLADVLMASSREQG